MIDVDPVVETATVGPGHDGRAELVLTLRHPGGAHTTLSLDEEAIAGLLSGGAVSTLDDLTGRRWPDLTPAAPAPA